MAHASTELFDGEPETEIFMIFESPEARAISGRLDTIL